MSDLLNGFNIDDLFSATSGILSDLAPVATIVLGVLLGFLILSTIVELITGKNPDDDFIDDEKNDII